MIGGFKVLLEIDRVLWARLVLHQHPPFLPDHQCQESYIPFTIYGRTCKPTVLLNYTVLVSLI